MIFEGKSQSLRHDRSCHLTFAQGRQGEALALVEALLNK